ncbi:matrixin family metalloprotease [bacterium]|nr:matrixin family metalloprotease [bacterium]
MKKYNYGLVKVMVMVVLGLFCFAPLISYGVGSPNNYGDTYIDEVYTKYKQIVSWKKNYILVYIPQDAREQFVWSQFKIWENVLGGNIIFEKVAIERNADIYVHYENQYLGKKSGFTRLSFKDGEIRRADLFLYDDILTNPLKNFAVLHEVGHALGITNHSPNPADIMYATKTARQNGLSQRDKNTIKLIYDTDVTTKTKTSSIDTTSSNRSAELQRADMMLANMQYEPALELYKKVLSTGLEQGDAYFGMAKCYYSLGNGKEAYKYVKKALATDETNKAFLYGYISIALDTNHDKELYKYLDKYIIEHDDAIMDRAIQSALITVQGNLDGKKKK